MTRHRPQIRRFSKRPYKRALVIQPKSLSPTGRLRLARMIQASRANGNAVRSVQWANGEVGIYSRRRYNHTNTERQRILVGCESSGVVRDAFRAAGHDAWSCDITDPDTPSPHHIKGDVRQVLEDGSFDMGIFHPPCQYLSSSGLHWNQRPGYEERSQKTEEALDFVRELLAADINEICLENPVGRISTQIRPPDQYIQPHEFGHDASKKTGLWLKNLPPLEPTRNVEPRMVGRLPRWANQADSGQGLLWPSANRSKIRAKTYEGIAAAMARQWGVPEGYVDYGKPQPYGFGNYGPSWKHPEIIDIFTGIGAPPKEEQFTEIGEARQ